MPFSEETNIIKLDQTSKVTLQSVPAQSGPNAWPLFQTNNLTLDTEPPWGLDNTPAMT